MTLEQFYHRFQTLVDGQPPIGSLIEKGRRLVEELASDTDWFRQVLERLVLDRQFLAGQKPSIWPNEVGLYRSPDRSFVVLAYIWEPRAVDIIHDHGSWGIIGPLIRPSRERKYRRLDDGRREGYAQLEEVSSRIIEPGDTTAVLPLQEGIHQMENLTDTMAASINIYGRTVRKGYVQLYDPEKNSVVRAYPPGTFKEVLAFRTLGTIGQSWAEDILRAALRSPLPDFLRKECEESLSLIGREKERNKG